MVMVNRRPSCRTVGNHSYG